MRNLSSTCHGVSTPLPIISPSDCRLMLLKGMQSIGKSPEELRLLVSTFSGFLSFCKDKNVPVVVAAGNQPQVRFVHDSYPQMLSNAADNMILVGGVTPTGVVWGNTVLDPNNEISVYAPAEDVIVPKSGSATPDVGERSGTSHAAAITVTFKIWQLIGCTLTLVTVGTHCLSVWPTELAADPVRARNINEADIEGPCMVEKQCSCVRRTWARKRCLQFGKR
jgi:hypothetical protein